MNTQRRVEPRPLGRVAALRSFLLLAAACAALAAAGPPAAKAGSYRVHECNPYSGHYGYPDASFYATNNGYYGPVDCGTSIGLSVQNPITISVGSYASWSLTSPPGTVWTNVHFRYSLYYANAHSASIWLGYNGGTLGTWTSPNNGGHYDGYNSVPIRANQLVGAMQCGSYCPQNSYVHVYMYGLEFDTLDEANPQVTALAGELASPGIHRGTESLGISAVDVGSGVHRAAISVNGAPVTQVANACAVGSDGIANAFTPCPSGNWSVPLNTELAPWHDGSNQVQVCVYDYTQSGTANSACDSRVIEVDNTCEGSGGSVQAATMDAGFESAPGQTQPSVVVRSTRGTTLRGTLRTSAGDAVPSANVCLYETADVPGQPRELSQIARTKNDGTFSVQVPAGPSRKLDLLYRYNNKIVEKGDLRVGSVVVPTLRIRPKIVRNGRAARFFGRVPGPNQAERLVSLQARAGKKWRTFKQLRTNEHGKFKGKYRFTQTSGRAIYAFRVLVKKQAGYPYEPGASVRRKVAVTG